MLGHQVTPWRSIEDPRPHVFMIGQVVPALGIQVLHVGRVAGWTHINSGSTCNLGQTRAWSYLAVGVVSELGGRVVHLAAQLLVLISARSRVLSDWGFTFSRWR